MSAKIKQYYTKIERYDWIVATDHLLGVESFFHRNRERVFTRLIRQYADKTVVLDVGCGTGLLLRHMKEDAIGLDINPWNVVKAKEHTGRQVIRADAEFLPLRSSVLDLAVCTETLEHLPNPLRALGEMGVELVGAVLDPSAQPLPEACRAGRLALLFGNEADGLRPDLLALCSRRVTIPMQPPVDSLNVAVAAGVFLHHFTRVCK